MQIYNDLIQNINSLEAKLPDLKHSLTNGFNSSDEFNKYIFLLQTITTDLTYLRDSDLPLKPYKTN